MEGTLWHSLVAFPLSLSVCSLWLCGLFLPSQLLRVLAAPRARKEGRACLLRGCLALALSLFSSPFAAPLGQQRVAASTRTKAGSLPVLSRRSLFLSPFWSLFGPLFGSYALPLILLFQIQRRPATTRSGTASLPIGMGVLWLCRPKHVLTAKWTDPDARRPKDRCQVTNGPFVFHAMFLLVFLVLFLASIFFFAATLATSSHAAPPPSHLCSRHLRARLQQRLRLLQTGSCKCSPKCPRKCSPADAHVDHGDSYSSSRSYPLVFALYPIFLVLFSSFLHCLPPCKFISARTVG